MTPLGQFDEGRNVVWDYIAQLFVWQISVNEMGLSSVAQVEIHY
jgi:hypothetical protein